MEDLKEKFKTEIEEADWSMLEKHYERDAVFIVKENLPLIDVAVAVAQDKVQFIKIWLDNNEIHRPSKEDVEKFEKDKFKKMCQFIIVQPYVLIRLLE